MVRNGLALAVAFAAAASLGACSSAQTSLPVARNGAIGALELTGAGKISHVVYIVQENRSFNDLFQGYPGAYTVSSGKDSKGETIQLKPISLAHRYLIDHGLTAMIADCRGTGELPGTRCRMDGFDRERTFGGPRGIKYPVYAYVPHS